MTFDYTFKLGDQNIKIALTDQQIVDCKLESTVKCNLIRNQNMIIKSQIQLETLKKFIDFVVNGNLKGYNNTNITEFIALSEEIGNEYVQNTYKTLLKKIKHDEDENNTSRNKQITQSIIVCGYDKYNQLGEKPNSKNKNGNENINPPVKLSLDLSSILSYSVYLNHSVLVTDHGILKGIGNNIDGEINPSISKTSIDQFVDFIIKDGKENQLTPVSAVCCASRTLYMFSKGNKNQLALSGHYGLIFLDIGNHNPVALFGGYSYFAAIGNEGEIFLISISVVLKFPGSYIKAFYLPDGEKASSVAFYKKKVVVLSTNGRVYKSKIENKIKTHNKDIEKWKISLEFSIVHELLKHEIICISGTNRHCFAVSKEGRVFACGSNECGELGLGKKIIKAREFTEIESLQGCKIRAAYAGCDHSLFQTNEGKIYSCGANTHGQLLIKNYQNKNVYLPAETIITNGASFCIAGAGLSIVFIGIDMPPNTPNMRIINKF